MKPLIFLISTVILFASCNSKSNDNNSVTSSNTFNEEPQNGSNIQWHWVDEFNDADKEKIQNWLQKTYDASVNVVGKFPFDVHFYIHRNNGNEPVPWAHTVRGKIQGVHFHVNPHFGFNEFLNDWTAPHEISHLSLPALGRKHAWFAEGYATYMQEQILHEMGMSSNQQMLSKYKERIEKFIPYYHSSSSFIHVADSLRRIHHFPQMYWGSVSFFTRFNHELQEKYAISVNDFIQLYQKECRLYDKSMHDLFSSFDSLLSDPMASNILHEYATLPAKEVILKY